MRETAKLYWSYDSLLLANLYSFEQGQRDFRVEIITSMVEHGKYEMASDGTVMHKFLLESLHLIM